MKGTSSGCRILIRLRLGDYRVRFHDLGDTIEVLHVKHRKDAYR